MNISRFILMVVLQLSVSIVLADSPGDIPISFPFFQSSQTTGTPDELMVGYGDWCIAAEGIHPGIDFLARSGSDQVLNPFDQTMYSLGADYHPDPNYIGYMIGIGSYGSDDGWALIHLGDDSCDPVAAYDWCRDHKRNTELPPRAPIDKCSQYCSMPLHLHVQWSHWEYDSQAPGVYVLNNPWETLENPFSSFVPGALLGYDQIGFKRVWAESLWFPASPTNTGIFFVPDGIESFAEYQSILGSSQLTGFQSTVHGAIDIVTSPFSEQTAHQTNEGNGIFSVGYEIFHQNPFSEVWESTESDEGDWGYRELFEAEGQIEEPSIFSNIYEAMFMDFGVTYFNNAYIVTNSGAVDPSQCPSGWDNIYTASGYVNDWDDGICQGAWDTFLDKQDFAGGKRTNRSAFFPDGRYAVEVNAVSHGARESGSEILPVDDLNNLFPVTEGIIVDNYLPGVGVVIVYSRSASSVAQKYVAEWMGENDFDNTEYQEQLAYLEELHEDLRFFQSLELGEEVSVPETFQIHPDPRNVFAAEIFLNSTPNLTDITAEGLSAVPFTDAECGIDDSVDAGVDPVLFLQEEIARVEGELDSPGNRNLLTQQYGYIPYAGASSDGETLNMLVIYSEPTMVENSAGLPIVDKIWMRGYIHENVLWDSRNHGTFVRDTPAGNAEQTALLQEQMGSFFPSEPDAEYAVHYTFQGNLPSEFCGTIQLLVGTDTRSSTVGPRDLAGHLMDVDPCTIPATRKGYESWASVSLGSYPGYESQSEPYYRWGVPRWYRCWPRSGETVIATIVGDTVAVVDLPAIGLQDASFFGRCLPWYGFWMYKDADGVHGFDIPVVRHNSTVIHHGFMTKFPKGTPSSSSQFWWGGPTSDPFDYPNTVSSSTRYFWMRGGNVSITYSATHATAISDAYVYCVDSQTGVKMSKLVAQGSASAPYPSYQSDSEGPDVAGASICKIYQSGAAMVRYSNPNEEYNFKVFYPPGGGEDSIEDPSSTEQGFTSVSAGDGRTSAVIANPVHESLDVVVSGESGDSWSLAVFDLSGRCVVSESGVSTEDRSVVSIDAGMLPSGVYMLKVEIEGVEQLQSVTVVH